MTIQEKLECLKTFQDDFIDSIDSELYVKIYVIRFHYSIIPQAKSYSALNTFKKALKKNKDYLKYDKLITNLENTIYSDINSTSPKKIREKLKNLSTGFPAKLPSDNRIKFVIEPYLNDNKRIYRLIDNFLDAESVTEFIGTRNLVKTFLLSFPAPCMVGLGYYKWTSSTMYKFIKLYFNPSKKNIYPTLYSVDYAMRQEYSYSANALTNLLTLYNSPKQSFYYLYCKQIRFQEKKDTKRTDRQYDQYFSMYIIDLDSAIKKYRSITTPLITEYGEYPNLEYFFDTAYKNILSSSESEDIFPVFFFNTKSIGKHVKLYNKNLKSIPNYQLIPFKDQKKLCDSISQLENSSYYSDSSISYFNDIFMKLFKIEALIEDELSKVNFEKYTSDTVQTCMHKISDTWKTSLDKLYNKKQTD